MEGVACQVNSKPEAWGFIITWNNSYLNNELNSQIIYEQSKQKVNILKKTWSRL